MIELAIANPLFSSGIISAIVPALSVIGQLAAIPAKKRNTIKLFKVGASAHAILNTRKMKLQLLYIMERPHCSEHGAIIRGPKEYPIK